MKKRASPPRGEVMARERHKAMVSAAEKNPCRIIVPCVCPGKVVMPSTTFFFFWCEMDTKRRLGRRLDDSVPIVYI